MARRHTRPRGPMFALHIQLHTGSEEVEEFLQDTGVSYERDREEGGQFILVDEGGDETPFGIGDWIVRIGDDALVYGSSEFHATFV